VAKGVRKIPSRRGGHVEPFTRVSALIRSLREYHYLSAIETADRYPLLRQDPASLTHASLVLQALRGLVEEEQPYPQLFSYIEHAWRMWPGLEQTRKMILEASLLSLILRVAGNQPHLARCMICSQTDPTDAVILDARHGRWRCLSCHSSFQGSRYSLAPTVLKVLRFISAYPERSMQLRISFEEAAHLCNALRQYVSVLTDRPWPMIEEYTAAYGRG